MNFCTFDSVNRLAIVILMGVNGMSVKPAPLGGLVIVMDSDDFDGVFPGKGTKI